MGWQSIDLVSRRVSYPSMLDDFADFPQEGFAIVEDKAPEVELCYPAQGCSEK